MELSEEEDCPSGVVDAVVLDRSRAIIVDTDIENNISIFRKSLIFDLFDHLYPLFDQNELCWVVDLGVGENPLRST